MRAPTRGTTVIGITVAAIIAATLGGARADSASAGASSASACPLLTSGQLRSTLGLSQSTVLRDYSPSTASSEDIQAQCDWGVWSGAPPTNTTAMFALARSGHAAQIAVETWAPRKGHDQGWVRKDYHALTRELMSYSLTFPGLFSSQGLPAHALRPPHLGHSAAGFITAAPGLAKGLSVAIGCWWEDKTYKAICLFDEEATSRPVAAHMLQFAKTAVPHVLG